MSGIEDTQKGAESSDAELGGGGRRRRGRTALSFFSRLMRWEEEGGQDVSVTSSSHFVCFVSLSGSPLFGKRKAGETNKTGITEKMLLISFHDKLFLAVHVPQQTYCHGQQRHSLGHAEGS